MGAVHSNNAIYLTIANGKISRKVLNPTDISVTRENKEKKIVHEEFYKGWKGRITNIVVKDHPEYGKKWNVTLKDEDGEAILQMDYSSGYSQAFLKTLPNVDLNEDVVITPNLRMEGDKKKTTIFLTQHGVALKHYYTKDNPNGIPQLKKIKVKGKETYDDSDIMEFLEGMVKTMIIPNLNKSGIVVDMEAEKEKLPF